jgi:acyl phosphate:glycerol-3-phosphate acyltransferase
VVVLGLVGDLVSWLPTHATWAGVVAGPLVLLGYLVGTIPFGYLLSRRRLRRQLDGAAIDGIPPPTRADADPLDLPGVVAAWGLSGLATLAVATVAWDVGLEVAPRGAFSAVGTFANQALGAWVSIALWTGAGAVVGHVAPVWNGFRGGTGVPPALALVVVYTPMLFVVGAMTFLAVHLLTGRPRHALLAALPVMVSVEYVAWIGDLQWGWGVTNGPEVALWIAVVAGVVGARNLRPAGTATA